MENAVYTAGFARLDITPPLGVAIPGAWSKDKLKAELDRLRGIGLTPLPKLNFSACHDIWMKDYSRMLSTKPYYEFCKDIITEVAELFGNLLCARRVVREEKLNRKTRRLNSTGGVNSRS